MVSILNLRSIFLLFGLLILSVHGMQDKCDVSKLRNLDICTDSDNVAIAGLYANVGKGHICSVKICGVLHLLECSLGGRWVGTDGKELRTEIFDKACDEYLYTATKKKVITKRGLFRRRRRSPPPPPPPPPPECGHPGYLPTSTVHVTKTSQGGVATYTCNSGYAHTAGDMTRTCQSNRQWTGIEPTCSYMNSCSSSPCVNGGTCSNIPDWYTCTCPVIWKGSTCEQVAYVCARNPCVNHERCIDGSDMYTCICQPGWSGQTCNIPVDCGHPGEIDNCDVSVSDTTLGHSVTYKCHDDYNMTSGNIVRNCVTDGIWSEDPPTCIYATSCKSGPCLNAGVCTDLLGDYSCACTPGWTGKTCDLDVQPPIVSNCMDNMHINATEKTLNVTWSEPDFTDPMATKMEITSNYKTPTYIFPWGEFTVQYSATKLVNGLRTDCIFNISVRPTPCEPLTPPVNGAILCNNWSTEYGQICHIACQEGYSIPSNLKYNTWWICGDNGYWSTPVPVPDCSLDVVDVGEITAYDSDYTDHVFKSCDSIDDVRKLKELYVNKMYQHGVSAFCDIYNNGCNSDNVSVKCN